MPFHAVRVRYSPYTPVFPSLADLGPSAQCNFTLQKAAHFWGISKGAHLFFLTSPLFLTSKTKITKTVWMRERAERLKIWAFSGGDKRENRGEMREEIWAFRRGGDERENREIEDESIFVLKFK